jgi:hypothetical protein
VNLIQNLIQCLYFSRISQDFNYSKIIRLSDYPAKKPFGDEQLQYPVKGSKSGHGLSATFPQPKMRMNSNFDVIFTDIRPIESRDGFHFIIHDPFEIPNESSTSFFTLANRSVEYLIDPKIMRCDESLAGLKPDE